MKMVEVIAVPVRYGGNTYPQGAQFEMQDGHVNEKLVKVIGDVASNPFEGMTVDELKAYAKERGIDIGKSSSEASIIKKIQDAQKAE